MSELDRVISKIKGLTAKTVAQGATEEEALAAAEKVGELLAHYNLSLDEIFLQENKCVTLTIPSNGHNRQPIDSCVVAIALFCDCKVWFNKRFSTVSTYNFFGMESDTQLAKYLFDIIDSAMKHETIKFKQSNIYTNANIARKTLSTNFQRGMASTINNRLRELKDTVKTAEEVQTEQTEPQNTQKPEPTIKNTNIIFIKMKKIESEFEKTGINIGKHQSYIRKYDYSSYEAGKKAGHNVSLNRPIANDTVGILP